MHSETDGLQGMTYDPHPIETAHVALDPSLVFLREALAANAHDLWARQRMADGWTLGPERDDHKKHHPGLIPYDDLAESEKEYDRIMAEETLKAIVAMGYQILPPAE